MQKRIFLSILFSLFCVLLNAQQASFPTALRCDLIEYSDRVFVNGELSHINFDETENIVESVQLVEIENKKPSFSWVIEDDRTGIVQTAFQVQVASTVEALQNGNADVWESKKISTEETVVKYNGPDLSPLSNYYWRVKIWNNQGEESVWSNIKGFKTGAELKDYSSAFYPLQQWTEDVMQEKQIDATTAFYDFGKAAFGRLKLTVDSKIKNDTLAVSFGEVISINGRLETNPGGSRRYRKILLPLLQGKHTYTLSIEKDKRNTGSAAILMPEYTGDVYPFRYCETAGKATVVNILRETVAYPFNEYSSYFECSDTLLNAIWDFCKYSIKATSFAGIYVDGDRERIPYEADAYINQLCHYGVDNEYTLARRSQEYMLFNATWPTEWILSSVLMAWEDYLYTGNADFIKFYYKELKKKTLTILTDDNGLISTRTGKLTKEVQQGVHYKGASLRDIVDWPHKGILGLSNEESGETDGFVFTDYNTVVNAYHNKALQTMSVMAKVIGMEDDSRFYAQRAIAHKNAFNTLLFDKKKGYYNDGVDTDHSALHSNMFALTFGLVPEKHVESVTNFVKTRGMSCSVYGSQHLLDAVYAGENAAYGLELLTARHDRGWGHAIYNVGTTISLEAWDNKYKPNQDWNHAWGAAPANIIPRRLMGIMPLEPGFKKIRIKPQPAGLEWGSIVHPTIKGDIKLRFSQKQNLFEMDITIPANTIAEVWVPALEGAKGLLLNGEEVKAQRIRGFFVLKDVPSGKHHLETTIN